MVGDGDGDFHLMRDVCCLYKILCMGATIPHCCRQASSLRPPRGRNPPAHWFTWRSSELGPDVAMYWYLCRAESKDSQGFRKPLWGKLGGEVRRKVPSFPW